MIRQRLTTYFFGLVLVLFVIEIPGSHQIEKISQQSVLYLPLIFGDFQFQAALPTPTGTRRPTKEPTTTLTPTITRTVTPFRSVTPLPSTTITPTSTLTPTITPTPTLTATTTYVPLPVVTLIFPTRTPTLMPSRTPTRAVTASQTPGSLVTTGIGQGKGILLALICLVWILLAVWLVMLLRRGALRPEDIDQP